MDLLDCVSALGGKNKMIKTIKEDMAKGDNTSYWNLIKHCVSLIPKDLNVSGDSGIMSINLMIPRPENEKLPETVNVNKPDYQVTECEKTQEMDIPNVKNDDGVDTKCDQPSIICDQLYIICDTGTGTPTGTDTKCEKKVHGCEKKNAFQLIWDSKYRDRVRIQIPRIFLENF